MHIFAINWWAVLVCTVFSMVNGSVWYHPKVFFDRWWKVVGAGRERPGMANMGSVWVLTILSAAVKAIFVGVSVNVVGSAFGSVTATTGLLVGAVIAVGLVAPAYLTNKLFAGHGAKIWAIEVGNHTVDLVAFGVLFAIW